MRKALAITVLFWLPVLAATACGRQAETKPPEASSPAPVVKDEQAAGELSIKAAGKVYERLANKTNKALGPCMKLINRIAEEQAANGDDPSKVRAACRNAPADNREFADSLDGYTWPAKVRGDVQTLIDETRANQLGMEELAKVRTMDGLLSPEHGFTKDTGAADLIRAKLDLPDRK